MIRDDRPSGEGAPAIDPRSETTRSAWHATSVERTFPAGSVVVREGDTHGMGFFVVADGEGTVSVGGKEVGKDRARQLFRRGRAHQRPDRTATVTATTDLRTLVMTFWDFRAFVKQRRGRRLEAARARRGHAPRTSVERGSAPLPLAVQLYTFRDPARFDGAGIGLDVPTLSAIAGSGFLRASRRSMCPAAMPARRVVSSTISGSPSRARIRWSQRSDPDAFRAGDGRRRRPWLAQDHRPARTPMTSSMAAPLSSIAWPLQRMSPRNVGCVSAIHNHDAEMRVRRWRSADRPAERRPW